MSKPLPETTQRISTENNTVHRDAMHDAFKMFWSAGMVKVNKAKAKAKFERLVRDGKEDPDAFACLLARDVKARIAAQVYGFDRLHPTTYLNGERWNDDIVGSDIPDNVKQFPQNYDGSDCGGSVCIPKPAGDGS